MTTLRWKLYMALGIAAGATVYLAGSHVVLSLVAALLIPVLVMAAPRFLRAAIVGAATPGAHERPADADMSGLEFEDYVARIARTCGVPVIMTPLSGDWGVDLIVGHRPHRLAVQCKRLSRPVGASAVQEVVAGAPMQDCTRTMVVTNHEFTPAARKLAELHGCELVGGADLPRLRSTIRRLTQSAAS
ncbi:restriction endonuclease [Mycobacterium sp. 236(2023)]|uniref:restriction endonuclease n=1 Tax=Mycobacterium sp. 236(2023) TaxID=3038163 RepID=UPI0024154C27|nr:restriction endonuclease [Mycobacterium sp. 236(2023)]MDG4664204.1 restriction endonuclease [Mycobacterium sp. 236(2023)]